MKFGIFVFPGSNCDRDVATVTSGILQQPTRLIWHSDTDISDCDVIVVPGGFSYGDYLRCGAIARFAPVMKSLQEHVSKGKYVLGICNGFQILTESGLLQGALVRNRDLHFICDRVPLRVERNDLPFTKKYQHQQVISLPIAHGEGCYFADADTLKDLEDNHQVVLRYSDAIGNITNDANPNGSISNIAGICNKQGNVLGMMPHPERAAEGILGGTDGKALFEGLLEGLLVNA
ncbi:MAG: phosphoribosylformylglycinamidine synthase subunit PurQ [Pseudanabaena sp. M57BS1SP1A06MG]|jgi:phosphoribosylformylglycinamidine synthase I|uniref:phosphoribosylformylglycinamidine synthase subunit PurQ n=1 Tax=Microcystis sp. M34BS1 TaxID=2771187 RepID=UPI00258C93C2|nr:phosphoribosylformylglycinamidine synthase subunit PurQ [Microcystis sp. M34BS1]MCA2588364.1 phosphoribosylformylglycinamidine synthase subunit PurQ [Microcystis sp. M34BS1]MCA6574401.1 phosphoribosylformylglycinamidine synthase subunit PurQ [Pseudanabaena sp. M53BS1SP1A06MG]MCA6590999.1 phosphoribosylformylglycinamidine synthase subunit PurQ [Pseudanabaena sp. M38BS1SP1A06MG]MCA6598795.1 phosphoribosylformylglycinamidine synthase subunit PurQ [Pseudanabaena sp. M57BS1SP1A06MG]